MKQIFSNTRLLLLIVSIGLLFNSCKKQLEEDVRSTLIAGNFVPTAGDIPALIAPVYSTLRPLMAGWQGYFDLQEESADAIVTPARPRGWYDGGTYQRMHWHTWTNVEGQPNGLWNRSFTGINSAKRIISQIKTGKIPVNTGKEAVLAELKTARAFYYYLLLDNHGYVPIVTNFEDIALPSRHAAPTMDHHA